VPDLPINGRGRLRTTAGHGKLWVLARGGGSPEHTAHPQSGVPKVFRQRQRSHVVAVCPRRWELERHTPQCPWE